MAEWMIAKTNLKQKKGVAFSTGLLLVLAVAMFHVGLTLISSIGNFYGNANDQMMGAHYQVRLYGNEYREEYLDYMLQDARVETAELQQVVLMDTAEFLEGGVISANFKNMDSSDTIRGYQIFEALNPVPDDGVYIPVFMRDMGYEPGDQLTLICNRKTYEFTVAGYVQSTWFASSVSTLVDLYMPEQAFLKLYQQMGGGYLLSVRLTDRQDVEALRRDFKKETRIPMEAISLDTKVMDFSIEEMQTGCTLVITILSAVLLAFSALIVMISLIVMKFRITNHIESQMVNIGALQAMGYTGNQIRRSIGLEFFIICVCSIPMGYLLSYGMMAAMSRLITTSVGVSWKGTGSLLHHVLSGGLMLTAVLSVSMMTAKKAADIQPVQALRQGMDSHSFQKNYVPLDKSRGPLSLLLGLKQVVFFRRTYVMTGVIFAVVTFAASCAVIIFINMGLNDDLVLQLTGYEISDILVAKAPHGDYDKLKEQLDQVDGIAKTQLYESKSVTVEQQLLTCFVSDDFSKLEMAQVYEGNFPQYDNEIVVTGVLAKAWGKKIGDLVTVQSVDGVRLDYVICGFTQTMNNFGKQCYLSAEGYTLIQPSYEKNTIQVYLEPGQDIDEMIQKLEQQFCVLSPSQIPGADAMDPKTVAQRKAQEKIANLMSMYGVDSVQYALVADGQLVFMGDTGQYQIDYMSNNKRLFISNVNAISASVFILTATIVIATAFIIFLVFYMVIKSMLVRRKREFGILKSLGYTDGQLKKQIAISFLPSSVAGCLAGLLFSLCTINRLSSMLFEGLGISRLELAVPFFPLLAMTVLIVLFSFGISLWVAGKMKDITVYELLTEV